ncbi:MAG: glycerol-3-phosphate 1-O-acyltransferase PlsY [candidate division WOR-3 bacterium]|nr:glycerol-3-phosphate 1-O-acyltransferase PlsY [candidate division WOR-3 bacterium]
MSIFKIIIYILATYLLGGIPFAYISTRIFIGRDIRNVGSGNVGATNVYRAGGLKYALPVFILDFLKGFIPVFISLYVFPSNTLISVIIAISAVTGHILSPYLKFSGGKGAATSFGAFIIIMPLPVIICSIIFVIIVALSRMVALGTITAAIILPVAYIIMGYIIGFNPPLPFSPISAGLIFLMCLFIIFSHRANIRRIVRGEENKI